MHDMARRTTSTVTVVIAIALVGGGMAAGVAIEKSRGAAKATQGAAPGVPFCGAKPPVAKPIKIVVTCGDGGEVVESIEWTSWSANMATGLATVSSNDCSPSCSTGINIDHAA